MSPRRSRVPVFAAALVLTAGVAGADDLLPANQPPDIDAFMQIGAAGSPQMHRSGGALYFTSNSSGVNQIYRLDPGDRWPYQLTVFADGVSWYTLSPDGKHLIAGVARGGDENTQLWLLDARTGRCDLLFDKPEVRYGQPAWTSDGRTIIYRSNEANGKDFYIYRTDLATRRAEVLTAMEGWNEPNDVSDDDRWMTLVHWDSNANTELYLVEVATGAVTHLTPHDGEALFYAAHFDAAGERVYLLSNLNPDGITRLARMNLATRDMTWVDPDSPWEVNSVGVSPDRSLVGWTTNEEGYDRLHVLEETTGAVLPPPPVDGLIGGFLFTDDRRMVFGFSSAVSTGDIWSWDGSAPELVKLTHSTYAGVDPSLFSAPTLVKYPSFDGVEIPAFLYLPPGRKEGEPVPFVLHMHGGPESQFRPDFIRHFQYLLLNGFGILAPNVRGSSGYGKAYMDLDNYKNRLDSVKDMKAGAEWLIAQGYSAPGMLAVKGGSYGGYMTMAAVTEFPDLFSAAIDEVGITNFVTFLENTADYRRALREAEYGPLEDREFLESISPLNKADRIRTPLLVIHGENDPRVPVGEAHQIADAIQGRGGEVELLLFSDEGHGVSKRPNVLTSYRKQVEFLNKYLKHGATEPGTEE